MIGYYITIDYKNILSIKSEIFVDISRLHIVLRLSRLVAPTWGRSHLLMRECGDSGEHAKLWGSSCCETHGIVFVVWSEIGIAAPERTGECFVENGDPHVEERLHGPSIPAHLLFPDHAL